MRMARLSPLVVSLLVLPLLSAGATIAHGPYQSIPVSSSPSGADVTLECNGKIKNAGTTPVVVAVRRRAPECRITLTKDGYEPASVVFVKSVTPWMWGNLVFGGYVVPGLIIDYLDGAVYNRTPASVQFSLSPKAESRAATR